MQDLEFPSLQDVQHELRARLLADTLRFASLVGERAFELIGQPVAQPLGLQAVDAQSSMQRAAWEPQLDLIDLDSLPVGKTAVAMYDYAAHGRHPIGLTPDVFAAELEAIEDYVSSFSSELFWQFFGDPVHSQGAPDKALFTVWEHARARLSLDMGDSLTVHQVALLSRLNERSVRNMLSASDPQQRLQAKEDLVDNEEARRWLRGKRGFTPTTFTEIGGVPGEHPDTLSNLLDLGRYLATRWESLGKSPESVAADLGWTGDRKAYLCALPAHPELIDPRDCEVVSKTLLVGASWFTAQVMRLKFPREIELLMQANEAPPSLTEVSRAAGDPDRLCTRLCFVLNDGSRWFPAQMKNQQTKVVAYRVSPGGKGGNTLEATTEVEDENEMIDMVVHRGYAVRMASERGGMKNQYKMAGRSVREVYLDGQRVEVQA